MSDHERNLPVRSEGCIAFSLGCISLSCSSSGLCKPSVSHLATRNKKQKCYSDDEDEQTNGDRLRASGQQQDEEERNSDDEREARSAITAEELMQKETAFSKLLQEKRKLVIKPMKEDGACLFRAVGE